MRVLRFAFMFALGALLACACDCNRTSPEVAAAKWLADMAIPYVGSPNCTAVDSDGDGYVTCTAHTKATDGRPEELLSLQCAALGSSIASGCKPSPGWKR